MLRRRDRRRSWRLARWARLRGPWGQGGQGGPGDPRDPGGSRGGRVPGDATPSGSHVSSMRTPPTPAAAPTNSAPNSPSWRHFTGSATPSRWSRRHANVWRSGPGDRRPTPGRSPPHSEEGAAGPTAPVPACGRRRTGAVHRSGRADAGPDGPVLGASGGGRLRDDADLGVVTRPRSRPRWPCGTTPRPRRGGDSPPRGPFVTRYAHRRARGSAPARNCPGSPADSSPVFTPRSLLCDQAPEADHTYGGGVRVSVAEPQ